MINPLKIDDFEYAYSRALYAYRNFFPRDDRERRIQEIANRILRILSDSILHIRSGDIKIDAATLELMTESANDLLGISRALDGYGSSDLLNQLNFFERKQCAIGP